ncbi:MAG TPA: hypothetical protein VM733_21575 [Thermoanaerobaculia bacterium]|nr:hypothetical protein [Thermoanaerobaculia bacterium]
MNVAFLLEDTPISMRVRLAMAQADALIARGHRARIVTKGAPVTWRSSRAEWIYVDEFREYDAREDIVVKGAAPMLIVDEEFYRDGAPREHEPLRVLLAGPAHEEQRGIDDGYGAVAHARWFHQKLDLIRVSPWAPSKDEPLDAVQEFHVALNTAEMARLLRTCDISLSPTFTLMTAEAMASGLTCLAKEENESAVDFGERLIEALEMPDLREALRETGRRAADQWRSEVVVDSLEAWLRAR